MPLADPVARRAYEAARWRRRMAVETPESRAARLGRKRTTYRLGLVADPVAGPLVPTEALAVLAAPDDRCPYCRAIGRGDGTYLCGGPSRRCSNTAALAERWLASGGLVGPARYEVYAEGSPKSPETGREEAPCEPPPTSASAGSPALSA